MSPPKKVLGIILFCFLPLSFTQCADSDDLQELVFIGDSHAERWDVNFFFPDYIVTNLGIGGKTIDYIESKTGTMTEKNVVVIIGTNDFFKAKDNVDEYVERYCDAIYNLKAGRTYVFSIFPSRRSEYPVGLYNPPLLENVNSAIKKRLEEKYPSIVYINVYDKLLYKGEMNPEYSSDGLHLNENGYELITQELRKHL